MPPSSVRMARRKRIALIAHDNRKADLLDWARYNRGNRATADFILSSPLMGEEYERQLPSLERTGRLG